MQEGREEREDGEHVELRHGEHLGGVEVVPVAQLVRKDGLDLVGLALLDQRVEDDDVFALWRTLGTRT